MAELVVEAVEGPAVGQTFGLDGAIELGRDPSADVVIADEQISKRHARLTPSGSGAIAEDLGSTNGTYVNGQPLEGPVRLGSGDQLRLGLTVLELTTHAELSSRGSGVRPAPQATVLGADVLRPAKAEEMPPVAPAGSAIPGFLVEETEPAFVPEAARNLAARGKAEAAGPDAVGRLVDVRVKRQTNVAAFAILTVAAILLVIFIGLR